MTSIKEDDKVPMTKIHIRPVDESMESAIREYFSEFGEIKTIRFNEGYGPGKYAFIRFFNTESANAAIAKRRHKIGGKTITAMAAHEHHQPTSHYSDSDFSDFSDFSD